MNDEQHKRLNQQPKAGVGGKDQHPPPRVTTNALMQGEKRIVIQHNNQDYLLQITRAGRLILTK